MNGNRRFFPLSIHDEFGHHRNKLNDIKTRLLTNAFVQALLPFILAFHPSSHRSPLPPFFSILELYQHNNARKIEAIVMMFISILLFFLTLPLYYFFFFLSYTYHAHRACIYYTSIYIYSITHENNTRKKEKNIKLSKRKHDREIKNFIHRIIDGKILTISAFPDHFIKYWKRFKATARLSVDIPVNPSSIISRDHHDNAELPFQVDVVILDSWILYHGCPYWVGPSLPLAVPNLRGYNSRQFVE